jgi:hypothetical protein
MTRRQRIAAAFAAACLSAGVCIATIVAPRWFELLFDSSPDDGDGSLETIVAVAVSALACLAFLWLGRREWRKVRVADARAGES